MDKTRGFWRGKCIYNGEWVKGDLVCDKYFDGSIGYFIFERDFDNSKSYTIDPSTLGECTGLRDKNGKLIFEGDIVEIKGNIGRVIFVDDEAGFVVDTDKKYFTMSFSSECEIVGNIHDNPELISERTN